MSHSERDSVTLSESLKENRKVILKVLIGVTIVIGSVWLLFTLFHAGSSTETSKSGNDQPKSAAAAKVTRESLVKQIEIAAQFYPFQKVDLQAKVAGYVKDINVDIGDRVTRGQVLATLEVPELREELAKAKAAINRYRGEIAHAQSQIRRYEAIANQAKVTHHRLFSVNQETPNLVAQQDIDVAYAQAQSTAAQVDVQKANLLIAQQQLLEAQARERRVQDLVDFARIISPFSGIVTKRYVDVGTMVQVGTESTTQALPVVEVSEVNQLRLIFPVPESAMALIQPDASATVEIPNLHKTFNTKIWRYAGKSDAKTRTMETQIKVENPNFEIKPGMVATVRLTLEQSGDTLTVPLGAVLKNQSGASVLVITPDHHIEERQVKLGLETSTKYEVVSGLSEKELVIVAGRNQLRVGDVVEPKLVTFEQIAN